jgi:hypothetical protein
MDAVSVEGRAASHLLRQKDELADAVTRALYDDMSELHAKYGDSGRQKCLQDLRYTIEHLTSAVDLAQPDLFASYVRWLDALLRARNVSTREVVRSLELMERVVRDHLTADEADAVAACLNAGLAALGAATESGG